MAVRPFLPLRHPVVEAGPLALMTEPWRAWATELTSVVTNINQLPGVNRLTLAELNALGLGPADEGYLAFEHVYGHWLRWTGLVWQFAPGDPGSGFWSLRPVAPQEVGWQLCDGTVTDYLTVGGATLTVTAHTTPNVTAGTFLKVLAAYTGAIDAAVAPGISGTPSIDGSTGTGGTHTHTFSDTSSGVSSSFNLDVTAGIDAIADGFHTHTVSGTTGAASALHVHDEGTLVVALGTVAVDAAARPPSLGGLLYFRR